MDPALGDSTLSEGLLAMAAGCGAVYGTLFATGFWLYGNTPAALVTTGIAVVSALVVTSLWEPVHAS